MRGTQQQNVRKKLSLRSGLVILKKDMLFRAWPKPKVMSKWIRLQNYKAILKSGWINITANLLSNALGLHGEKSQ